MEPSSELAMQAAGWWAQQVGAPTFRNVDQTDSREDQLNGLMVSGVASQIADANPVSEEESSEFQIKLAKAIDADLAKTVESKYWSLRGISLRVDYGQPIVSNFEHAMAEQRAKETLRSELREVLWKSP